MVCLRDLPTEVLGGIFEQLCARRDDVFPDSRNHSWTPAPLAAVAQTCSRFASVVSPYLYRTVDAESHPDPDKRLVRFLRTALQRPDLANLVHRLAIHPLCLKRISPAARAALFPGDRRRFIPDPDSLMIQNEVISEIKELLQTWENPTKERFLQELLDNKSASNTLISFCLVVLPRLKELKVSCTKAIVVLPWAFRDHARQLQCIQMSGWRPEQSDSGHDLLFQLPSLKCLSISQPRTRARSKRITVAKGTSNVTRLHMKCWMSGIDVLTSMMTACRVIEEFSIFRNWLINDIGPRIYLEAPRTRLALELSPKNIVAVLESHNRTLRTLSLDLGIYMYSEAYKNPEAVTVASLKTFSCLEYLNIHQNYIRDMHRIPAHDSVEDAEYGSEILTDFLPTSITSLSLRSVDNKLINSMKHLLESCDHEFGLQRCRIYGKMDSSVDAYAEFSGSFKDKGIDYKAKVFEWAKWDRWP